jgi:CheY-like chemotaxis protein
MGNNADGAGAAAQDGRIRILVIDDDEDVRDVLQVLLESEGYAVSAAADGHEGLLLQRRSPAAVVVTDIFMPGKEGIETVVDLVQEFPQTKVIVVSGAAPQAAKSDTASSHSRLARSSSCLSRCGRKTSSQRCASLPSRRD